VLVEEDGITGRPFSLTPGHTNGFSRVFMAKAHAIHLDTFVDRDQTELWLLGILSHRGPLFGTERSLAPDSSLLRGMGSAFLEYRVPFAVRWSLQGRVSFDLQHREDEFQDQPEGYFSDVNRDYVIQDEERFPEGRLRRVEHRGYRQEGQLRLRYSRSFGEVLRELRLLLGFSWEYDWLPHYAYGQNFKDDLRQPSIANHDGIELTQVGKDRLVLAPYLQGELNLLSGLWITAGLRVDHYTDFGTTVNPRGALVWQPRHGFTAKLLYGRAFRAPTFRELYDKSTLSQDRGRYIRGNPSLEPETTHTVELAVQWAPWEHIDLRLTTFYIQTDDVIDITRTYVLGIMDVINYPGVRMLGAEGEILLRLDPRRYLMANVSWIDRSQLGDGIEGYESQPERRFVECELVDLPRWRANVLAIFAIGERVSLGGRYSYTGASRGNARFEYEVQSLYFERHASHEAGLHVIVSLLPQRLDLISTVNTAFGSIPVAIGFDQSLQAAAFGFDQNHVPLSRLSLWLGLEARL
jgi:outer membrane receptor protein involved in Fe transport